MAAWIAAPCCMPHGLRKPAEGRSHWNVRKPQRGTRPRPSAHPWAFFTKCSDCRTLKVANLCLYALVLDVERCADVVFSASIVVNVALLTYFCMLRY